MDLSTAERMQALYSQFGELPGVTIELYKELIAVTVSNDEATATLFLQGAQLSHYQRHGEEPVIWCSPLCDYASGSPLRGGIPVCWPWFGDAGKNPDAVKRQLQSENLPAHGFVRNLEWEINSIEQPNTGETKLLFVLQLKGDEDPSWPHATELRMQFHIGAQLTVTFSVCNQSTETIAFSSALHSYFALSEINNVHIDGLSGLEYTDCLQDWTSHQQQGQLFIREEVDRIYHGTKQPISIVDQPWQRTIEITSEGSQSAVIWNPWINKSRRLSQFDANAFKSMLCIETANADRDHVELGPSGEHHLTVKIKSVQLQKT